MLRVILRCNHLSPNSPYLNRLCVPVYNPQLYLPLCVQGSAGRLARARWVQHDEPTSPGNIETWLTMALDFTFVD